MRHSPLTIRPRASRITQQRIAAIVALVIMTMPTVAAVAALLIVLLKRERVPAREALVLSGAWIAIATAIGVTGAALATWLSKLAELPLLDSGWSRAAGLLLASLPLAPIIGPLGAALWRWRIESLVRGGTRLDLAMAEKKTSDAAQRRWAKAARCRPLPASTPEMLHLGWEAGGQNELTSLRHRRPTPAGIPWEALRSHALIIGATGSGKTTTLLRLTHELRRRPFGRHPAVVVIDPKPEAAQYAKWRASLSVDNDRVVTFPQQPYDIWRGDGRQVAERLLAVINVTEPYYHNALSMLLRHACDHPTDGPPRSWDELLTRMSPLWLRDAWHDDPQFLEILDTMDRKVISGARMRIESLRSAVGHLLRSGDDSWAFEDVDAAYVALDATVAGDEAKTVAALLFADLSPAVRNRSVANDREMYVVVDEAPQLVPDKPGALASMFETLRSAGVSVLLASQSRAGLGPDADRILASIGGPSVVHRAEAEAEEWSKRVGTQQTWETSTHLVEGGLGNEGMVAPGDGWVLSPQILRGLHTGRVAVCYAGTAVAIDVMPIPGHDT